MTETRLHEFAKAWNDRNVDLVMSFFTDECCYSPSVIHSHPVAVGKPAVLRLIELMMEYDDSVESKVFNIHILDGFGFWEWEYKNADDSITRGCDVFEFVGDRIKSKKAFRKLVYS